MMCSINIELSVITFKNSLLFLITNKIFNVLMFESQDGLLSQSQHKSMAENEGLLGSLFKRILKILKYA